MSRRHGHWAGNRSSRTWSSWAGMWQRCTNPKSPRWKRYGARGITVCDRWEDFVNFLEDMGERPKGMQLDRVDNDGPYCKENCKWSTVTEQCRNRSTSKLTLEQARTIRHYYASGKWTMKRLGEAFGVTKTEIGHIVHNRHWEGKVNFVSVDLEEVWPVLINPGYLLDGNEDTLHNLGVNLVLAGALATAANLGLAAGIDLGVDLVMRKMQEREMVQAAKGKSGSILVPSRQLILPGIK